MASKAPTYRERAIATSVNNRAAIRDLVIDLAAEIDYILAHIKIPPNTVPHTDDKQTPNQEN